MKTLKTTDSSVILADIDLRVFYGESTDTEFVYGIEPLAVDTLPSFAGVDGKRVNVINRPESEDSLYFYREFDTREEAIAFLEKLPTEVTRSYLLANEFVNESF